MGMPARAETTSAAENAAVAAVGGPSGVPIRVGSMTGKA